MFSISQKLKLLKTELKKFNRDVFLPEMRESLALEGELKEIQKQLLEEGSMGGREERENELFHRVQLAKLVEEDVER